MDLNGRVALVTGAAVGIGRAIALRLAGEGADVLVADVDEAGGDETVRQVAAVGGSARFVRIDMTADDDVRAMIEIARERSGRFDVVVNNAGGGGHIPPHFPDATPAQWGATLALNLRAPMLTSQFALEAMPAGGVIVNVASTAGLGDDVAQSPEYAAAKAGLIRFTTALREHEGVRVSCVVPDWIRTARAEAELAAMSAEKRRDAPQPIPMDVVTGAVLALIADETAAGRVVVLPAR